MRILTNSFGILAARAWMWRHGGWDVAPSNAGCTARRRRNATLSRYAAAVVRRPAARPLP